MYTWIKYLFYYKNSSLSFFNVLFVVALIERDLKHEIKNLKNLYLKDRLEQLEFDDIIPDWEDESWGTYLLGTITSYKLKNIENYGEYPNCKPVWKKRKNLEGAIRIATDPFSKGSFRVAHYCQFAWESSEKRIGKVYLNLLKEKEDIKQDIWSHGVASYYAKEFNDFCGETLLEYSNIDIFECGEDNCFSSGTYAAKYILIEDPIENFTKYNNNFGYISNGSSRSASAQAFSHFSYVFSGGTLMIVDIQGGKKLEGDTYLLSDPCIHHKDLSLFGSSNLGKEGFEKFFNSHVCNSLCETLGLPLNKFQTTHIFDTSGTRLNEKPATGFEVTLT